MTWADYIKELFEGKYPVALIFLTILVVVGLMFAFIWAFRKPLAKYFLHERLGVATKAEVTDVKTELKADITNVAQSVVNLETRLKENDFYHSNKAMLLIASELLKNNPERFERVKDTILESTPDNRKDEIKSITI